MGNYSQVEVEDIGGCKGGVMGDGWRGRSSQGQAWNA